jgi:hypothetical protein
LSGSGACFADAQAYAHDAEDSVAFFQVTGGIEIARAECS